MMKCHGGPNKVVFLVQCVFLCVVPILGTVTWSIVEQVHNKIRSLTQGIGRLRTRTSGECLVVGLYILLKSHSSVCCLLSNLNFELLKSVAYANSCACVRAVREN